MRFSLSLTAEYNIQLHAYQYTVGAAENQNLGCQEVAGPSRYNILQKSVQPMVAS